MSIEIKRLTKEYSGGKRALDNIDLTIKNGLFGLLGPNGAGKTTLMRILVTLMNPDSGSVKIDGYDLQTDRDKIRSLLGYLPQDFTTFGKLRTWEFLDYSARLSLKLSSAQRTTLIEGMLDKVGLFAVRDRQARKLSGGMKRRLGIAQALVSSPRILVVDEPTTGLDPEERIRFRNLLTEMANEDRIIILSTHIVGDISSTCNDMALLYKGSLAFNDSPVKLIEKAKGHTFELNVDDSELFAIKEKYPVIATIPSENGWKVQVVSEKKPQKNAITIDPNLEHAYVYFMTGKGEL